MCSFTEGFDTLDLKEAKVLLDESRRSTRATDQARNQSSKWLTMPSASFGSNQVDFGGMIAPASATAMRSLICVGYSANATAIAVGPARKRSRASTVANDIASTRTEQCKAAQDRYQNYVRSRRLYKEGPNKERMYLTDAELETERVNAKREADDVCTAAAEQR